MSKDERVEKVALLTTEIFDEYREVFEALAKGSSSSDSLLEAQMDAVADSLMERRSSLFEKLAEGLE